MSTDLAVIEAALAAATPGPWWWDVDHWLCGDSRDFILSATCPNECCEPSDIRVPQVSAHDARLIANAPAWLSELVERVKAGAEGVRAFSEALGFGDGRTEPAASLEELIDPLRDALSAARDHDECPAVCELCGERLASTTCEKCHGSGCLPNPEMAYLECDECAGVGKVHVGCVEESYAQLVERVKAAEATIARVHALADRLEAEWPSGPDRDGAAVAHLIRTALNHSGGITSEAATSGEVTRFTSENSPAVGETTLRARAKDTTEPILRPTDQRYELAVDDERGFRRG